MENDIQGRLQTLISDLRGEQRTDIQRVLDMFAAHEKLDTERFAGIASLLVPLIDMAKTLRWIWRALVIALLALLGDIFVHYLPPWL